MPASQPPPQVTSHRLFARATASDRQRTLPPASKRPRLPPATLACQPTPALSRCCARPRDTRRPLPTAATRTSQKSPPLTSGHSRQVAAKIENQTDPSTKRAHQRATRRFGPPAGAPARLQTRPNASSGPSAPTAADASYRRLPAARGCTRTPADGLSSQRKGWRASSRRQAPAGDFNDQQLGLVA